MQTNIQDPPRSISVERYLNRASLRIDRLVLHFSRCSENDPQRRVFMESFSMALRQFKGTTTPEQLALLNVSQVEEDTILIHSNYRFTDAFTPEPLVTITINPKVTTSTLQRSSVGAPHALRDALCDSPSVKLTYLLRPARTLVRLLIKAGWTLFADEADGRKITMKFHDGDVAVTLTIDLSQLDEDTKAIIQYHEGTTDA